jgi:hypothetical protein
MQDKKIEKASQKIEWRGVSKKADNGVSDTGVAALALFLMNVGIEAHIAHLQTPSFAQHMALNELYQGIPDLADTFIEAFQGKYGIIAGYPNIPADVSVGADPIAFVEGLQTKLASLRTSSPPDSELQNILDEIAALFDSTAYKLKNLS